MRWALGLRWQDIDLANQAIHIRQQIQRVHGELHIGPVKTRAGSRLGSARGVQASSGLLRYFPAVPFHAASELSPVSAPVTAARGPGTGGQWRRPGACRQSAAHSPASRRVQHTPSHMP